MSRMDDIFYDQREQPLSEWFPSWDQLNPDPLNEYLALEQNFPMGSLKEQRHPEQALSYKTIHSETHQHLESLEEQKRSHKTKSPFHNFQKHLITNIKRINMFINQQKLNQECPAALKLWSAFLKTRSFKKKVLHMVFGLEEDDGSIEKLTLLSKEFQEFAQVMKHFSPQEILKGQEGLRQIVAKQAFRVTRQQFKKVCQVNRFEQFYEYFISFMEELRNGPLNMRMTKQRKQKVMEKVKKTKEVQE